MKGSPLHAEEQLQGTPYLVSRASTAARCFSDIQHRSLNLRKRALATQERISTKARELFAPFRLALRTHLVAESNRLEGLNWTAKTVAKVVDTHRELLSVPLHNLLMAVRNDRRVLEALGLYRAHELAEAWAQAGERPREFEIRSLHALVAAGESYAGNYKTAHNRIGGSKHKTTDPIDVPRAMSELASWWMSSKCDPILAATVVHAWLTHIHPFVDGNGRMARLLANLALAQSGYPSLVLRSASDRGQYLDALAESDDGDILPLYELFTSVIARTVRIMARPQYVREVLDERLLALDDTTVQLWHPMLRHFREMLGEGLAAGGWKVEYMGHPDVSAFQLLRSHRAAGNCWFVKVRDETEHEAFLLWFGFNTLELSDLLGSDERFYPSIFVSIRDHDPKAAHRFRLVSGDRRIPDEILVRPVETQPALLRYGYKIEESSSEDAATRIALGMMDYRMETHTKW